MQTVLQMIQLLMMILASLRRITSQEVSLILLYLSWPVCLIHRFWNNTKPKSVNLFLTDVHVNGKVFTQDVQWYIYDTGNIISSLFILLSFVLLKTKTRSYVLSLKTLLTINIVDLIHYWTCFKQDEIVTWLECMLMVALSLYLIRKKWKKA